MQVVNRLFFWGGSGLSTESPPFLSGFHLAENPVRTLHHIGYPALVNVSHCNFHCHYFSASCLMVAGFPFLGGRPADV